MQFVGIKWTSVYVCLPLTTPVIFWMCCVVRREQVPTIYYTNLLISNVIQFSIIIFWKCKQEPGQTSNEFIKIICIISLMANLYFRMFITIERCFVITCPQSNWIRQTGGSLSVSFLVWILCISAVSLSLVSHQLTLVFVFGLLPGPLFIFFSAWTFKALPAATSVPADEKQRIVAALVLLFINYFLMILPTIICFIVSALFLYTNDIAVDIAFVFLLLSPFADLILVFFMRQGPIDKLLSCICITDNTAENVAGHQQLHELMLQRERERVNQTV